MEGWLALLGTDRAGSLTESGIGLIIRKDKEGDMIEKK